jgi:hypothetical protein
MMAAQTPAPIAQALGNQMYLSGIDDALARRRRHRHRQV